MGFRLRRVKGFFLRAFCCVSLNLLSLIHICSASSGVSSFPALSIAESNVSSVNAFGGCV